ncbi:hypothetical protein AVEN_169165-1 [Araneus ventricosus]|uniref:Uncharacterized protein n=1 Tax=Araneus ventricosus TaxID=182803 RepID=A0A4Y2KCG1_ARAVE|nr:hypothetical protein AVEN_169165-1 [Araneus ventricosus]
MTRIAELPGCPLLSEGQVLHAQEDGVDLKQKTALKPSYVSLSRELEAGQQQQNILEAANDLKTEIIRKQVNLLSPIEDHGGHLGQVTNR